MVLYIAGTSAARQDGSLISMKDAAGALRVLLGACVACVVCSGLLFAYRKWRGGQRGASMADAECPAANEMADNPMMAQDFLEEEAGDDAEEGALAIMDDVEREAPPPDSADETQQHLPPTDRTKGQRKPGSATTASAEYFTIEDWIR